MGSDMMESESERSRKNAQRMMLPSFDAV